MTHDPLCPAPLCDYTGKPGAECMGYEDCWHDCQCALIARVREDEAVKRRADLIWQDGYDIALRDAVDAIRTSALIWDASDDYTRALSEAVAAIESLGGER